MLAILRTLKFYCTSAPWSPARWKSAAFTDITVEIAWTIRKARVNSLQDLAISAMTAAVRPAQDAHGRASQLDLRSDPLPVVAVDIDAAEIVAANAAGSEALGLFPYASFPIALDPSTPALVRLRQLAGARDGGTASEPLIFWSSGRQKSLTCRIARQRNSRSRIFLLHVIGNEIPADTTIVTPPRHSGDPTRSSKTEAAVPDRAEPKINADTLKEIARQIREGDFATSPARAVSAVNAPSPTRDTSSAAPTADAVPLPPDIPGPHLDARLKTFSLLDPDHLAKLAHEIKTPLTAIAAAAEVMRDECLGEMGNKRYLSYAADIHESATHALNVVTSLLSDTGRPNAAASRLIALDLNAIVERTVSSMQVLAESRGLTLAFDADAGRPHVIANPTAVRQILLNLLANAIKFTPRHGDVRVATGSLEDGRVFLAVRDTGCGMNTKSSAVSDIATGNETPQPSPRGNGIGLPLVKRLVREMGADIEIDSAPGKGTAVVIAFGSYARWSA